MQLSKYWRLQRQRYSLVGEECGKCGLKIFPPRDICPREGCGAIVRPRGLRPEGFDANQFAKVWAARNKRIEDGRRK